MKKLPRFLGTLFLCSFSNLSYAEFVAPCLTSAIFGTGFQHEEFFSSDDASAAITQAAAEKSDGTIDLGLTCKNVRKTKVRSNAPLMILVPKLTFNGFFYVKNDALYLVYCLGKGRHEEKLYTADMALEHKYTPNRRQLIKNFLLNLK